MFTLNIARYFVLRRTLRFRQLHAKDAVCIDPNLEFLRRELDFSLVCALKGLLLWIICVQRKNP